MSLRRVDSDEFFLSTGQGLRWAMVIARTIVALALASAAFALPARAQDHETPNPPMNRWSFAGRIAFIPRGRSRSRRLYIRSGRGLDVLVGDRVVEAYISLR